MTSGLNCRPDDEAELSSWLTAESNGSLEPPPEMDCSSAWSGSDDAAL